MNKLRNFLWKNLGITLDKQTLIIAGIVVIGSIAAMVFGVLAVETNSRLFRILFVLIVAPSEAILFGSIYRPLMWSLSSKSERQEIEREVALKQLKRRANDKHFEH